MKRFVSARATGTKRSAIRELLRLTEQPEIISFGGGLPAPETFPHLEMADIAAELLKTRHDKVLQYGMTEGSMLLRRAGAEWLSSRGIDLTTEQILVTSSSQQGLDLVGKAIVDPGDVVFCGLPTYLGAIQAFRLFQAQLVGVPLADDGMDLDVLEVRIDERRATEQPLKVVYVVPDFQNPSGITMSLEKRRRLLEIARREDLLILEDDPYGQLRFSGEAIPSIRSLDDEGRVIMLITFSKVLAAGLRLALLVADGELMEAFIRVKQPTDLCTSKLLQYMAATYMERYGLEDHLEEIRVTYRKKRDAMVSALDRYMPADEGVNWTHPEGGLFVWLRLPEGIDAEKMLPRAIEAKVAYVVGSAFFVDGTGQNTARLSYSVVDEATIEEGVKRLARVVREEISARRVEVTSV